MGGTVLVTGGASGIGLATARLAASRGWDVAINYRSREAEAAAAVAEIRALNRRAVAVGGDVASESDVTRMFDEAERALGPISGLVNSAGHQGGAFRVEDLDRGFLAQLFAVNTIGPMICCREAARRLSTKNSGKGGAIVNVSSMSSAIGGRARRSHYAACKAALDAFTVGFAREVAREGIRVNTVRPGMVETDMTANALRDAAARADIESTIAMARVARAEEIAAAIVWLLSGEASFVSGATLDISGGGFVIGKPAA
jgi:NAD(P)-dependent dehydrogenase (short-subunit alcohol dehydrogenase family)